MASLVVTDDMIELFRRHIRTAHVKDNDFRCACSKTIEEQRKQAIEMLTHLVREDYKDPE